MDTTRTRHTLTAFGLAAVLLTACGGPAGTGGPSGGAGDLAGDWLLIEGSAADGPITLVEGHDVTLRVDGDQWGGSAHCNTYGSTVTVDDGAVTLDGVYATEMACLDQVAMTAEAAYLGAFGSVTSLNLEGDVLELSGDDVQLTYERIPAVEDAALVGTRWLLESLVSGAGPDGAVSDTQGDGRLLLDADGRLDGSTGCNQITGDYELDVDVLRIGELTTTRMACDGPLDSQEEHVLAVLGDAPRLEVVGRSLFVSGADGRGLGFRAAG